MFAPDGPESIPLVALPVAPGRILVADDNAASLRLVSRLLMRDRHTVLTETDSRRVVDRVTRNSDKVFGQPYGVGAGLVPMPSVPEWMAIAKPHSCAAS